jgi:hypothetical protein
MSSRIKLYFVSFADRFYSIGNIADDLQVGFFSSVEETNFAKVQIIDYHD